jgi:lipopolysaccharide exporter
MKPKALYLDLKARTAALSGLVLKAVRGTFWLTAGSGVEQALRFVRNMVLARVLAPQDFGTMAIVLAVSALLDSLTQVGVREFVIQNKRSEDPLVLNGTWWFSSARGVGLYVVAFFAAPWIAQFYGNPSLVPMLRVALLGLFFKAAISTRAYFAIKRMEFRKWILIEQVGGSVGVISAIILSFVLHSVWALIIGFTLEYLAQCILSFLVCPFYPRLEFDSQALRELFSYARGMLGIPLLVYVFLNADVFVLGKLRTPAELGMYSLAVSLAQVPILLADKIVSPVLMPAFSEMQSDLDRVRRTLLRFTAILGMLLVPSLIFVSLYAVQILSIVYTMEYSAVAVPFTFLVATVMCRTLIVPLSSIYLSLGLPKRLRFYTLLRAILMLVLVFPSVKYYGLRGAAASGLISNLAVFLIQVARLKKLVRLGFFNYWFSLLFLAPISSLLIITWGVSRLFLQARPLPHLVVGILGLLIVYSVVIVLYTKSRHLRRIILKGA